MHPTKFAGLAAFLVAGPSMAEMQDQWRPADCASVDAQSLEAELLDCDPSIVGTAATGGGSRAAEVDDEAAPAEALSNASSWTPLDLASLESSEQW